MSSSSYFSRNREPNNKPNIKDHWSMAKVETALAAESSVCDLAELSPGSMTHSPAVRCRPRSGPRPGLVVGKQGTQGTKLKEALALRCLPCTGMTLRVSVLKFTPLLLSLSHPSLCLGSILYAP